MKTKKIANLRICASCEWIFELKHFEMCPKCLFIHYSAHYVYGKKCYRYKLTQEPWKEKKLTNHSLKLNNEINDYNKEYNKENKKSIKWKINLNSTN